MEKIKNIINIVKTMPIDKLRSFVYLLDKETKAKVAEFLGIQSISSYNDIAIAIQKYNLRVKALGIKNEEVDEEYEEVA